MSGYRLPAGGRDRPIAAGSRSRSTGGRCAGFAGDTLASALLANGGQRRRAERPPRSAAGHLRAPAARSRTRSSSVGAAAAPELARATQTDWSTDSRPGRCAARARCPPAATDRAEHRYVHCEVLVVGGGWAGVEAARAASPVRRSASSSSTKGPSSAAIPQAVAARRRTGAGDDRSSRRRARRVARYDANLVLVVAADCRQARRRETAVAHPGAARRRRDRRLRAAARLPQQRPARHHAGRGCRARTSSASALRPGGAPSSSRTTTPPTHAALDAARPPASRSPAIVDVRAEGAGRCMRDRAALRRHRGALAARPSPTPTATVALTGGHRSLRPGRPTGDPERHRVRPARRVGRLEPGAAAVHAIPGGRLALRRRDRGVRAGGRPCRTSRSSGGANGDGLDVGRDRAALVVPPGGDGDGGDRHFVDLQRDATLADLRDAVGRGLRYPEHVKRWTTIGTGNDQGRTSAVNEVGILAELTGQSARVARADRVPAAGRAGQLPTHGRARTAATCSTRSGRRRPTRATSRSARCSRTSASGSAPGPTRGRARSFDDAVLRECRGGPRGRRHDGRLDARQDRRPGPATPPRSSTGSTRTRSRTLKVGHSALRADVPRRRHGPRRRHDDAPRRRPLLHDDDDRRRRGGPRLARGMEPDRVAGDGRAVHVRHRPVGRDGDRRAAVARRSWPGSRPTSTCRPRRSRS